MIEVRSRRYCDPRALGRSPRLIEDQANRLGARCCRARALRIFGSEGGLDRRIIVFGRDLDHRCALEV